MAWFKKKTEEKPKEKKKGIPKGLWVKCNGCEEIIYGKELELNNRVCPLCQYHFKLTVHERINLIIDEQTFIEYDKNIKSDDPLSFKDLKRYEDRLKNARGETGLEDALVSGEGKINGQDVVICVLTFDFMGGSMASVVGEKIFRAVDRAIKKRFPVIIVSASGGARMQEGILSLMQMAKTTAALAKLGNEKLPYISVLTDPTTGGVTASFASIGDVIISEPKALIGFTGARVIEQTIGQKLPEGFQRAEFLLDHGMIDMVVERKDMKKTLAQILDFFKGRQ